MCFCFDGEHALLAYQPDECRVSQLADSAASRPTERKALSMVQQRRRVGDAFAGKPSEAPYPL